MDISTEPGLSTQDGMMDPLEQPIINENDVKKEDDVTMSTPTSSNAFKAEEGTPKSESKPALNHWVPGMKDFEAGQPKELTTMQKLENYLSTLHDADKKKFALNLVLERNRSLADMKWSLFCAACHSYRYDSVLRPFPCGYVMQSGFKDIDFLREVASSFPDMQSLYDELQTGKYVYLTEPVVDLLYYVLVRLREPALCYVDPHQHTSVLELVNFSGNVALPQNIFAVLYDSTNPVEIRFNRLKRSYSSTYGFHGSRVDNFYSILKNGLQVSLNKVAMYGPGIYLSSELSVSLPYSPAGFTWNASAYGNKFSVVALCEMINHPDVKCQFEGDPYDRAYADGSQNGPVPSKYFVVQNSELVRVRYLLLYSHKTVSQRLESWFQRNKLLATLFSYIILLVAVGLSRSPTFLRIYRKLVRRLGLANLLDYSS